jgi:hypothetical protein
MQLQLEGIHALFIGDTFTDLYLIPCMILLRRYISNAIVYMGTSEEREAGILFGIHAVLTVVQSLENHRHVIVVDNFFTSITLGMSLLEWGFWMTGTVKKSSKGFPSSLARLSSKSKVNIPPRGYLCVKMHRSRKITTICWIDNKLVWLLSTSTDLLTPECVHRVGCEGSFRSDTSFQRPLFCWSTSVTCGGSTLWISSEWSILSPSPRTSGGIVCLDLSWTHQHTLRTSYIGMLMSSRLLWLYKLGMALLRPYLTLGHIRGPHRHLALPGFHRSEGYQTLGRNCVVCERRTRCLCNGCAGAFMCSDGCYIRVHTQPRHAANFCR